MILKLGKEKDQSDAKDQHMGILYSLRGQSQPAETQARAEGPGEQSYIR